MIYYLSHRGRDTASGSVKQPWKSLSGARDNLRKLRSNGTLSGPVTVEIAEGTYPLTESVQFAPEDSQTSYVAAPKAQPVFEGSKALTGWTVGERNGRTEWTLDLPEVAAGNWNFKSLFVNDRRATRARLPKFTPDETGADNVFRIGAIKNPEDTRFAATSDTFKPKPEDVQAWESLPDAEVVLLHYWSDERLPRPQLDPRTGWLRFARQTSLNLFESYEPMFQRKDLARYYVDNLFEALSEPGEWYLNRVTGRLHYLPRPGETPDNTEVRAPVIHTFIQVRGTFSQETRGVSNPHHTELVNGLTFEGLTFRHADWYLPFGSSAPGYMNLGREYPTGSGQAAALVPGSIGFRGARSSGLRDCTIERSGLYGIEFAGGCRDCFAIGNHLHDLGAGGIRAGGSDLHQDSEELTGNLTLTDNHIHHLGRVFHSAVGLLLQLVFETTASHNHIHHTGYTGISLGWIWGYRDSVCRENRLEHNHIHDIGGSVLSDMGGIYTLGVQPGTVIRGNHLHDIYSHDYGGWGIYLDEATSHLLVEHNLVHDTKDAPFNIHYGRENIIRHNIFARGKNALTSVSKVEDSHVSATFIHNILIGPSDRLYYGGYQGDISDEALAANANLFWSPGGKLPSIGHPKTHPEGKPFKISLTQWRKLGHDSLSQTADPKITEGKNTWTLAKNSPAHKLGFKPWDWSNCGVRPKSKRT